MTEVHLFVLWIECYLKSEFPIEFLSFWKAVWDHFFTPRHGISMEYNSQCVASGMDSDFLKKQHFLLCARDALLFKKRSHIM